MKKIFFVLTAVVLIGFTSCQKPSDVLVPQVGVTVDAIITPHQDNLPDNGNMSIYDITFIASDDVGPVNIIIDYVAIPEYGYPEERTQELYGSIYRGENYFDGIELGDVTNITIETTQGTIVFERQY